MLWNEYLQNYVTCLATHKTWTCTCMTAHMQTADMTATHATMRQEKVYKLLFISLDLLESFTGKKIILCRTVRPISKRMSQDILP